ncbi:MAG: hypothetical protein ACI9Y1_000341 [Lentisphaeria bacterium]
MLIYVSELNIGDIGALGLGVKYKVEVEIAYFQPISLTKCGLVRAELCEYSLKSR